MKKKYKFNSGEKKGYERSNEISILFFFVLFNKVFIDISIFIHILMMANFIHFFPINAIEMEKKIPMGKSHTQNDHHLIIWST